MSPREVTMRLPKDVCRTLLRPAPLVLALTLAAASETAAQERFTLDQIMSSPFPETLTASADGQRVAWVQNAEGVRNIWIADAPSFEGRQVTSYDSDDGQAIAGLSHLPGGRLLFVRGGAPNRRGEIPNPTSEPDGTDRAIWVVDTGQAGAEPERIAEGSSPAPSPDGSVLAFIRAEQTWTVRLDGQDEEEAEAERLFSIRGNAGSLRWSPDGSALGFVSGRGDHSFVGVYELESGELRYLDPSLDRDREPVWSPDGRRIAFVRAPNERQILPFAPRSAGLPWSIRVADAATGAGREIWRASDGTGSVFRGVVAANQLLWTADDRIVFPWERDGWTHLFSVSVAGGAPVHLTPGEFEVEDVTLSLDGTAIVYSSNQDDIDRRHLWRVAASGGGPTRLTAGRGIEWAPAPLADGNLAYLTSDATTPAHSAILAAGVEPRGLAPGSLPGDFPIDALVEPEGVVFTAADGMPIHGQLFLPSDLRAGERHPAVLFFHGGSRRQMLLGWHYRGYYHNAYALNQYLASRGYVVLSVNYRSGIGYGMEFREAIDYGAGGASEFRDVLGAGLYLRGRADVDPDRIGLWGGSYGGYLTALGLARASDLFAAGVDLHGVHDWNVVIRNFVQTYDAGARAEFARLAFESSPMASIDGWRSPVLLIHGDDDRNVPFSESMDLIEALRRRDVDVEQLVFPDEVHGFLLHRNWLAAYQATADFFDRRMGGDARTAGRGPGS